MTTQKGYVNISGNIPEELYLQIQLAKEKDMRTLSSFIAIAVKEYTSKVLNQQDEQVKLQDCDKSEQI